MTTEQGIPPYRRSMKHLPFGTVPSTYNNVEDI